MAETKTAFSTSDKKTIGDIITAFEKSLDEHNRESGLYHMMKLVQFFKCAITD